MIKTISTQSFQGKETDQQSGLILTLLEDGKVISIDEPVEVRARNFDGDIAVLKSTVSDNTIVINPSAELPNGTYSIEVLAGDEDVRQIYPSKGYLKVKVDKALLTGDSIKLLDSDGLDSKIETIVTGKIGNVKPDDTGWIDLITVHENVDSLGAGTPQYRIKSNQIFFRGVISNKDNAMFKAGDLIVDNSQTLNSDDTLSPSSLPDNYTMIDVVGLRLTNINRTALVIIFINDQPVIYNFILGIAVNLIYLDGISFPID